MFEPVRGGTRGGQAEFKWSDVSADKDRENYLGHSINAPTGRWQKNKDVHWYARDKGGDEASMREEIRRVKEQEAEALAAALGFGPSGKSGSSATPGGGPTTGANAIAVPDAAGPSAEHDAKKEEKRKRKEEKRLRKEKRRAEKEEGKRHRHRSDSRSRSRSPRRHKNERSKSKHRSRSPPPRRERDERPYDESQREKEREWARRRWEDNARREQPAGARWGRD